MLVSFNDVGVDGTNLNFEIEFTTGKVCRVERDIGVELVEVAVDLRKYVIDTEIDTGMSFVQIPGWRRTKS